MCYMMYVHGLDISGSGKEKLAMELLSGVWGPSAWGLRAPNHAPGRAKTSGGELKITENKTSFDLWDTIGFAESWACSFTLGFFTGFDTFSRADWLAACLTLLPMKCSLKIKLPCYTCIVCYAWSVVLWNRLVRAAIHSRAKSNQLDIDTETVLSWRECQSKLSETTLEK